MLFLTDHRSATVLVVESLDSNSQPARINPDPAHGAFRRPYGLLVTTELVLVADGGNNRVVVLNRMGKPSHIAGTETSRIGPLANPRSAVLGGDDRLVVADTDNHRIVFGGFTLSDLLAGVADLSDWTAFGAPAEPPGATVGDFGAPTSVYVDAMGRVLVADARLQRLVRFDAHDGTGWTEISLPPGERSSRPYGLAAGPGGGVLITDIANGRVLLLGADEQVTVLIDGGASRSVIAPVAAVMDHGEVVVADAVAAQLTSWALEDHSGQWRQSAQLLGTPGPMGGPKFSAVCGLASTGGTQ